MADPVPDAALQPMSGQFARTTGGWIYRANGRGPAYRLTDAEAQGFQRRMRWGVVLVGIGFFVAMIVCSMVFASLLGDRFEVAGPIVMAVALMALMYLGIRHVMLAPARALAGRQPVAPAMSDLQVKRRAMRGVKRADIWAIAAGWVIAGVWKAGDWPPVLPISIVLAIATLGFGLWNKRRWEKREREGVDAGR